MRHNDIDEALSIEEVSQSTKEEAISFLKRHEEFTMFMLSNLEAQGYKITDSPNSGNFKLIRRSEKLIGVFCLARRGSLLIQSEMNQQIASLILESCKDEEIAIKGVVGDWNVCSPFWEFLKDSKVIKEETFISKEVLFTLNLSELSYPKDPKVRLLNAEDYPEWRRLNKAYILDQKLPNELKEELVHSQFLIKVNGRIIWGLFLDGKLTTVADLNAKAMDLGQVGGVFTSPDYRKRGLATTLIQQLTMDAKNLHNIRKLIIFTAIDNTPARKVYESLGVKQAGYFALLFGK